MQDSTLLVLILIAVAIGAIVQTVALVGAFVAMRHLEARFQEAERELRALRPQIETMGRVVQTLAELTENAGQQIPRVVRTVESAVDQFRNVAELGATLLIKPLRPLGAALAIWRGLKNGAATYRKFRPIRVTQAPAITPLP
ncbi:MAG: hypothetical protein ABIR28_00825 [Vicinamibacteria bacterium]